MEEDDMVSVLCEPLSLSKLVDGTDFRIDPLETGIEMEFKERSDEEDAKYNEEHFSLGKDKDGNDTRGNPGLDSFESFASKMTNITTNGSVKKRVLRQGQLGTAVPRDANVEVHYNAYLEFCNNPFDSTFIQKRSSKFSLLCCIEGLAVAIQSMQKKERAQILLQPEVAYKAQGIPPRIPANAEILYELELIDFEIVTDEAAGQNSRQSKTDFKKILAASRAKYEDACSIFEKGDVQGAFNRYHKAMNMLERCTLANKEEEIEQEKLLLRLYTNLAVCLNKMKKAPQACNMCKCALKINPNHPKALFHFGRALITLSEFEEARTKLRKAERLQPNDQEIKEELKKVDSKQEQYLAAQKLFASRAFSSESNK